MEEEKVLDAVMPALQIVASHDISPLIASEAKPSRIFE
jgi:hypothetical protein